MKLGCNCKLCDLDFYELSPSACPLCGSDGIPDSTAETFGCSTDDGFPYHTGCHFAMRENFLPPGVWNALTPQPKTSAKPRR